VPLLYKMLRYTSSDVVGSKTPAARCGLALICVPRVPVENTENYRSSFHNLQILRKSRSPRRKGNQADPLSEHPPAGR
jgi:hypothetical protein